ncbi:MAG: DUF2764 family protein [Flavobacteriales bacterium]|nr:DUF2764 family protein [Flavobacteriales bacterium]
MTNQYYGLVSGLQHLAVSKPRDVKLEAMKEAICSQLEPSDLYQVLLAFYLYDHQNLLTLLSGKSDHLPYANLSNTELQNILKNRFSDDLYFTSLLDAINSDWHEVEPHVLENKMTQHYYTFVESAGIDFLKEWFKFEITFKNLSAVYVQKTLKLEDVTLLEGGHFPSAQIARINLADLDVEFPFLKRCFESLDIENPIERNRRIDEIRWEYLDDLTFFNFFGIEKILAYVIKFQDLEKWKQLDPQIGKELLTSFLAKNDKELESKLL